MESSYPNHSSIAEPSSKIDCTSWMSPEKLQEYPVNTSERPFFAPEVVEPQSIGPSEWQNQFCLFATQSTSQMEEDPPIPNDLFLDEYLQSANPNSTDLYGGFSLPDFKYVPTKTTAMPVNLFQNDQSLNDILDDKDLLPSRDFEEIVASLSSKLHEYSDCTDAQPDIVTENQQDRVNKVTSQIDQDSGEKNDVSENISPDFKSAFSPMITRNNFYFYEPISSRTRRRVSMTVEALFSDREKPIIRQSKLDKPKAIETVPLKTFSRARKNSTINLPKVSKVPTKLPQTTKTTSCSKNSKALEIKNKKMKIKLLEKDAEIEKLKSKVKNFEKVFAVD